jgi:hypothetical protein
MITFKKRESNIPSREGSHRFFAACGARPDSGMAILSRQDTIALPSPLQARHAQALSLPAQRPGLPPPFRRRARMRCKTVWTPPTKPAVPPGNGFSGRETALAAFPPLLQGQTRAFFAFIRFSR